MANPRKSRTPDNKFPLDGLIKGLIDLRAHDKKNLKKDSKKKKFKEKKFKEKKNQGIFAQKLSVLGDFRVRRIPIRRFPSFPLPEAPQGLPEGSDGLPEGSEGLSEGAEGLTEGP